MGLTAGIIGLPNVGKSTLFNAITKSNVLSANYPFATIEPNVGIVTLYDKRVDHIAKIIKPRNTVYTTFSFTDIAGLVKGASKGEGLGNQFLSHIREVDAICHVVRCFEDDKIIHIYDKINPLEDIETINLELAFADLEIIDKRLPKIEKKAQFKQEAQLKLEYKILTKLKESLENNISLRNLKFTKEELEIIKAYSFLSLKPMIYILNISENEIAYENDFVKQIKAAAKKTNNEVVVICAKLEEELSQLEEEDKTDFLEQLGFAESGLNQLSQVSYNVLGLETFFTAGEKEVRAWTFKKGMKASECAGLVHSDFEKHFIRAEVTSYSDFLEYGSLLKAKEAGKMRLEGKEYIFQDGDIVLFRVGV